MKAIPTLYNVFVTYSCEYCERKFNLKNFDIPTEHTVKYNCKGCGNTLIIDPIEISINQIVNDDEDKATINKLKKFLKKYGYSSSEAKAMIQDLGKVDFTQPINVLLKLALATKEPENE